MKTPSFLILSTMVLAAPTASASIVLYSSSFGGSSGTNLNGTALTTSGATGAQHALYGTSASATWSAATAFKADGSFADGGTDTTSRSSATIAFTPQNGYVYQMQMTTNLADNLTSDPFHLVGFFMASGYTGNPNAAGGATVWALTRPGTPTIADQVAHFALAGGAGNVGQLAEDSTAPSTLRITLDTTGGTGNWSATYHVGNGSGGFNLLGSVADLGAVDIESVGIGVYNRDFAHNFQSFELSVIPEPSTAILGGLGFVVLLRRRR
ncbi:MAG: PEP-CTERM sorting domain-containing protein [Akkermansiaceae bacterium]|nr:PEP-CTERM sorting domain-containing protein [Akkermansiaceae bacterium]